MSERRKTGDWTMAWHNFLDSLDTDGGTRLIAIFLLLLGIVGSGYGVPKMEDLIVGSVSFLYGFMKATGSNKDRREGPPMPLPTNAGASPAPTAPAPVPVAAVAPIVEAVENVAAAIKDEKP